MQYEGAVLRPYLKPEDVIIQNIVFRPPQGHWVTYRKERELLTFPLHNHFPREGVKSIAELTRKEFVEIILKFPDLPAEEFIECYLLIRG